MDTYSQNDSQIQEWTNQIMEHIITVCLLLGADSDDEFQKGCEIVNKLISFIQEITTLPSELLADRVKQLLEQQLPDARVINSLPTFQPTMDRMLRECILKVTDSAIREEVFHSELVIESVIPAFATAELQANPDALVLTEVLAQADAQAKAGALALAGALAQAETQAKVDAQALANALAQVVALTQAEKQAKADVQALAKVLALTEAQAKADALAFADALIQAQVKAKADAQALHDALNQVDALTQAEKQAKADALALADVLAQADALTQAEFVTQVDAQAKTMQANLLKRVLTNVFPNVTVDWNKSIMGHTFLAQVEDILICLHDPEHPCNMQKYNEAGWKVLVYSTEDLTFPRRLERGIKQIQRSGLG